MSELILSASVATNDTVFAEILKLHVREGSIIADITYGKGTFWKRVDPTLYTLKASDLKTGIDCRALPYEAATLDAVVFDPPYIDGFFRPTPKQLAHTGSDFRDRYSGANHEGPYYHEGVLDIYERGGAESYRVLRENGVLIVKTQDEVSNHQQRLTHVEVINAYARLGFYCKDLFVVVRRDRPHGKRIITQVHARKNHSYFLVFVKTATCKSVPVQSRGAR